MGSRPRAANLRQQCLQSQTSIASLEENANEIKRLECRQFQTKNSLSLGQLLAMCLALANAALVLGNPDGPKEKLKAMTIKCQAGP
jgi:hypothetical protein